VPGNALFGIERITTGQGLWLFLDGDLPQQWFQRRAPIPRVNLAKGWHLRAWSGASGPAATVPGVAAGALEAFFAWDPVGDIYLGYFPPRPSLSSLDHVAHLDALWLLLGGNGAGKTTTLKMIAGILRPDEGRILIDGFDVVEDPTRAKSCLGYVPDRPFVYEKLTGVELLRFAAGLYGQQGEEIEDRIHELLALWDLERWADELVESYSHGMRQKLIISAALIHRPRALVIDEPMVGLDPRAAKLLKDLLRAFADSGGCAMISTHTLAFAEVLCDRLAVIDGGTIIAHGTMDDLRAHASSRGSGLEEIFLRLTGGESQAELIDVLAR